MALPKYVEKALKDRSEGIKKARRAGQIIDDYAKKLGCYDEAMAQNEGAFATDIQIYCETDCAESITRGYLLEKLQEIENGK